MIKLENVYKSFGENSVLENFSLELMDGERLALMGRSGSGKTTVIRLICGLEKAERGAVTVEGRLSAVFQEDRLFEELTVYKNVAAVCNDPERIRTVLEGVLLWQDRDKKIKELSGGMARRVAIARAVCFDHSILILDEAFKGLDDSTREKVGRFILNEEKGKSILLITHDEEDCRILDAKRIVLE